MLKPDRPGAVTGGLTSSSVYNGAGVTIAKRLTNPPTRIALLAVGIGVVVSLIWLVLDIAGIAVLTWPNYALAVLVVYGWAGFAAYLGARLRRMVGWLLIAGIVPLLLWNFIEVLGAADITHVVPLLIYCWAIASAFGSKRTAEGRSRASY